MSKMKPMMSSSVSHSRVEREGHSWTWWSECSKVHREARRGLLVDEDKPGQRFIGGYMVREGAS